jgi:hypothetical protein
VIECLGVNGEAIDSKMGFHRVESEYNEYGLVLGTRWYDKNARACNGPDGFHYVKDRYDSRGVLTESAGFDVNIQPAADKHGIHQALFEYNEKTSTDAVAVFWSKWGASRRREWHSSAGDGIR